jgi:hypothetical protein
MLFEILIPRVGLMWSLLFKVSRGVLRIRTDAGLRYVALGRLERVYLLWVFRHFRVLPIEIFSGGTVRVERLLSREKTWGYMKDIEPRVIGTVDAVTRRRARQKRAS